MTARPCRRKAFSISMTGSPGAQAERLRRRLVGAQALEREQIDRGPLAQAVAALDVEELEHEPPGVVRGDIGAAPLPAHDDVLGHELVDGLSDRADRDAELGAERGLARQRIARAEPRRLDGAEQGSLDRPVERHAGRLRCDRREGRAMGGHVMHIIQMTCLKDGKAAG